MALKNNVGVGRFSPSITQNSKVMFLKEDNGKNIFNLYG